MINNAQFRIIGRIGDINAQEKTIASSSVKKGISSAAMSVANVVLPDCLGPGRHKDRRGYGHASC